MSGVALLTGFPKRLLATRVLAKLLAEDDELEVRALVPSEALKDARAIVGALPSAERARVELLEGQNYFMDLGLSGAEYLALARELTLIHHCGGVTHASTSPTLAEQENVGGMRELIELAGQSPKLERLVHWSTAAVSGARSGYVLEDELSDSFGFHNEVEHSHFTAEKLLRTSKVPYVVLRPTTMVGDSVSGEVDRLEGPYLLVLLMLGAPDELRLPMPGSDNTPLNLVPMDYVVDVGMYIAGRPSALGRTFHIVDPDPLTTQRVIELIADATGRAVPRAFVPGVVTSALLRAPGLNRLAHVPRVFLDQLRTEVVHDSRNTREQLRGSDLRCPGFEEYVEVMVRYVRAQQAEIRARALDELLPDHEPLE